MCLTIELLDASLNQSTNIRPIRLAYQPLPTIFFSQNKPTTNHQLTILFSQNKSASIGSSIEMLPSSLNDINKIICVQISQLAIGAVNDKVGRRGRRQAWSQCNTRDENNDIVRECGGGNMMARFERHEQWRMRLCWCGRDMNDDDVGKVQRWQDDGVVRADDDIRGWGGAGTKVRSRRRE
jgi:hypothetical protein